MYSGVLFISIFFCSALKAVEAQPIQHSSPNTYEYTYKLANGGCYSVHTLRNIIEGLVSHHLCQTKISTDDGDKPVDEVIAHPIAVAARNLKMKIFPFGWIKSFTLESPEIIVDQNASMRLTTKHLLLHDVVVEMPLGEMFKAYAQKQARSQKVVNKVQKKKGLSPFQKILVYGIPATVILSIIFYETKLYFHKGDGVRPTGQKIEVQSSAD